MTSVTTHHAKTHLSKLIAQVKKGEEILILHGKEPAAKLVAVETKSNKPKQRPVGVPSSPPVKCSKDAFAPLLTDKELKEWGFL